MDPISKKEIAAIVRSEARMGAAAHLQAAIENAAPGALWGEDTVVGSFEWELVRKELDKIVLSLLK